MDAIALTAPELCMRACMKARARRNARRSTSRLAFLFAGFENVTAAERAAAARALGITVPAWRTGQRAYFDLNPSGSIDGNPCVPTAE